jgi:hypothetical protein
MAQPGEGKNTLSGIVVNSQTGEPIRKAVVTLARIPNAKELEEMQAGRGNALPVGMNRNSVSGINGEYQFTNLPAGLYSVHATKPGYARVVPGEAVQEPVDLSASVGNFAVRLVPNAAIEGTVTDQNGDPVSGVKIELFTSQIADGERSILSNRSTVCDDRGGFRIWDLTPGQYYVKATGNGSTFMYVGAGTSRPSSWLSFVPVYADGARAFDSATPVNLVAGENVRADFRLNLVPSAPIRGSLEGFTPHQQVIFSLRQEGEDLAEASRVNLNGTTGKFEIPVAPPGDYILTAAQGQLARGEVPVHVADGGVNELTVAMWPPVTLTGTVHDIGPPDSNKKPAADDDDVGGRFGFRPGCQVNLHDASQGDRSMIGAIDTAPQSGDAISISGVFPGQYRVGIACNGGYVTSAMYGTVDLLTNPRIAIQPGATPPPLEIAFKPGGGAIHGTFAANLLKGLGGVLAVPEFSSSTGPVFEPVNPTQDAAGSGEFEISGLAPGDYVVYGFATMDQIEFRSPAILQALTGGARVHVDEEKTSEVMLTAVSK